MTQSIDFDGIKVAALRNGRSFVQDLIPGGKFRGLEYIVRNPKRDDQRPGSFSINYGSGVWKDFATGDCGGDFISLFAFVRGYSQSDAARELAERFGMAFLQPNGSAVPKPLNDGITTVASKVYPWGDNGPPQQRGEIRRHVYRREGVPVRIKIKQSGNGFTNWYRIFRDGKPIGWQAKKPEDYQAAPYVTADLDPFDPELRNDQLFWPEGEKDVDTLNKLNLPAFTFGGGDGLPGGVEHYLKDRRLVILADNDEPGRTHAEKKATLAHAAAAASIKIVHFLELPPKSDVSDFIERGGTIEQLNERLDAAPIWLPPKDETESSRQVSSHDWRARFVTAKDLQVMTFPPARHILPGNYGLETR